MALLDKIKSLEKLASPLEPVAGERALVREKVIGYSEDFLERLKEAPAFITTEDQGREITASTISEEGLDIESLIKLMKSSLDGPGLNPASGGHLGYIPGGGIYYCALGDYLADIMNRYAGVYFVGPGAVRMEHMLLEWMASVIGYPRSAGGNLTSSGSIANLVGIVAAREAHGLRAREFQRAVIYFTDQVHHSVDKAIRIAGLKECTLRIVPVDSLYRMDAAALERSILEDKKSGLNPWLVIASAGTTDTGAVDPLDAIAGIATRNGLWVHVDGAYGAFFVLCAEGGKILGGMEKSDSIVMDPHKGLFLPYGTGAVLLRDRAKLYNAFWYQANYLQDALQPGGELSPADLSPELSKHFRGLRLWLPLKLLGLAPFRAALEEKLLLARYFHEKIKETDGFEAGPFPDLSVVTYRYLPGRGNANEFNEKLVKEIQRDGRVFISSTMLNGKFVLRLAVLSFRSHLDTIDLTLKILREKAEYLRKTL